MRLGLKRGSVTLSPHREEWHQLFADERERIVNAIGDPSLSVEHIGSTSICGISAKPILDIMVGTPEFEVKLPFVAKLEAIGYEYKGENGVPERHFFGKGTPRTIHLNVVRYEGQFWLSHVAFRNYLIQDCEAAVEYEQLKLELAERFANDRESYTNGKLAFVERILAKAEHK
jgi:GrpB-like predicted nucleotidyltransferase (UPF0157 family)